MRLFLLTGFLQASVVFSFSSLVTGGGMGKLSKPDPGEVIAQRRFGDFGKSDRRILARRDLDNDVKGFAISKATFNLGRVLRD